MKLFDIIKKVGGGVIKTLIPGSGLLIDTVNEFLPKSKKLGKGATGDDLSAAIESLPPDQRASVMEKEFDVEIVEIQETNKTNRTMLEAEANSTHTTRPKIAYQSFQVIAFSVIVSISIRAYGVVDGNTEMVKAVDSGWPFILSVTGPLVTLLLAYFGVLKTEQKNRLDAANGASNPVGLAGIISMFKK